MKEIEILLIEDNEGDILLTREALADHGITNRLNVIKDGEEAINHLTETARTNRDKLPDLILLDINLPKFSGHEILEKLNSTPELKEIPVFMLTTSSSESDITRSKSLNAAGYIVKPLNVATFLSSIPKTDKLAISIIKLIKQP